MKILYTAQVRSFLKQYEQSLKEYKVSKERRKQKLQKIREFLQNQYRYIDTLKVCDKKDLGQQFTHDNKPIISKLKQTRYQDESEYDWSISLYKESKNVIRIYCIKGHNAVNELEDSKWELYEKLMLSISQIVKRELQKMNV